MPIESRSYGTVANVCALVPRYGSSGAFTDSTRPTLIQVENWINQVSAIVNMILADLGFTVPVTQADAVKMLAGLVESAVADYAEYANRAGRFFSDTAAERGLSISKVLRSEITNWLNDNAKGLENLGVSRSQNSSNQIVYRATDESGDEVVPLFQRKAFGDRTQNWDQ